jgi:phosphopantetheine--protein transferase-like protein
MDRQHTQRRIPALDSGELWGTVIKFSIGCDLEEIRKFEKKASNEQFLKKVYTKTEMEYCLNKARPIPHFAARWCAKEAVIKALSGLGINLIEFTKIEIINNTEGYPEVYIHDPRCESLEPKVSLSHSADMVMATAIISCRE